MLISDWLKAEEITGWADLKPGNDGQKRAHKGFTSAVLMKYPQLKVKNYLLNFRTCEFPASLGGIAIESSWFILSDSGLLIVQGEGWAFKKKNPSVIWIERDDLSKVIVTNCVCKYYGLTNKIIQAFQIQVQCKDGMSFTRFVKLGEDEATANQERVKMKTIFGKLTELFSFEFDSNTVEVTYGRAATPMIGITKNIDDFFD